MDFTKFGEERIIEYPLNLNKFEDHITNTYNLLKKSEFKFEDLYEEELQRVAKIALYEYYINNYGQFRIVLDLPPLNFKKQSGLQVPRFWYQMLQQIFRPMYYGNEIYIPKVVLNDEVSIFEQETTEIEPGRFAEIIGILTKYYESIDINMSKKKWYLPAMIAIDRESLSPATPFTTFKVSDTFTKKYENYCNKLSRDEKVYHAWRHGTDKTIPVKNIDHGIIESGEILTPTLQLPEIRIKAFSALLHCRFNQLNQPTIDELVKDELPEISVDLGLIHNLNLFTGFANKELVNSTRIWPLPVEFDDGMIYAIYNDFHSIDDELDYENKKKRKEAKEQEQERVNQAQVAGEAIKPSPPEETSSSSSSAPMATKVGA